MSFIQKQYGINLVTVCKQGKCKNENTLQQGC